MKCEYCGKDDHLVSVCPRKAGDRRGEVFFGALFFIFLVSFFVVGLIVGAVFSAMKSGFEVSQNLWNDTWNLLRGRKRGNGEQDSV